MTEFTVSESVCSPSKFKKARLGMFEVSSSTLNKSNNYIIDKKQVFTDACNKRNQKIADGLWMLPNLSMKSDTPSVCAD